MDETSRFYYVFLKPFHKWDFVLLWQSITGYLFHRYVISFLIFLHIFAYVLTITATNFWLTYWINEGGQVSQSMCLFVFCVFTLVVVHTSYVFADIWCRDGLQTKGCSLTIVKIPNLVFPHEIFAVNCCVNFHSVSLLLNF